MSVVSGKRGTGDLTVITKANELVDYTLQICTNEKNFPKRYRWCVTNRIIDCTYEICDLIIHANAVYVRPEDDSFFRRVSYQTQALELTEVLLNQIHRAYRRFIKPGGLMCRRETVRVCYQRWTPTMPVYTREGG